MYNREKKNIHFMCSLLVYLSRSECIFLAFWNDKKNIFCSISSYFYLLKLIQFRYFVESKSLFSCHQMFFNYLYTMRKKKDVTKWNNNTLVHCEFGKEVGHDRHDVHNNKIEALIIGYHYFFQFCSFYNKFDGRFIFVSQLNSDKKNGVYENLVASLRVFNEFFINKNTIN